MNLDLIKVADSIFQVLSGCGRGGKPKMTLVCNGTREWPSHSNQKKDTTFFQKRNRRLAMLYLSRRFGPSGGVGNENSFKLMRRDVVLGDSY